MNSLIGYTGFVGSNIYAQHEFDDLYNSKNVRDIQGKSYDLVVSAANRAEMWRINQDPATDLAEINSYIDHIKKAEIGKLVLISTVGVYETTNGVDEDTVIDSKNLLPYGKHRLYLEQFCHDNFDTTIVRLPGLFGNGLKKNVIFDLINNSGVEKIHKDGVYQYYNLDNIWKDIKIAIDARLDLINFATEPIRTQEVAREAFNIEFNNSPIGVKPAYWEMQTKYGSVYGQKGRYLYTKDQVLSDIKKFVELEKGKRSNGTDSI